MQKYISFSFSLQCFDTVGVGWAIEGQHACKSLGVVGGDDLIGTKDD